MNSEEEEIVPPEIIAAIDRFLFANYLECFNSPAMARAMAVSYTHLTLPTID